jgi:hypothetical protein
MMGDFLRRAVGRVRAFFHKAPMEEDLDAEMASHLEFAIEENLRCGMTPEEARRKVVLKIGHFALRLQRSEIS